MQQSGHSGFKDTPIPEKCPQPLLIEDKETKNNSNDASNKNVQIMHDSGTSYFSSAQDPLEGMTVYESPKKLL